MGKSPSYQGLSGSWVEKISVKEKKLSKVLVIGGGGREHTLAWKLAQSLEVDEIVCAPGNGGTARESKCRNVDIAATDIFRLRLLAELEKFDLTVVGPEAPLIDGIVNQWPEGQLIWGPEQYPARLEGSKIFAKQMMDKHNIPTAWWQRFYIADGARSWLARQPLEIGWVVKADGLAAGKGVFVCNNYAETMVGIDAVRALGIAGENFFIEERLTGKEASLFLLVGKNGQIIPLETAQDYKRVGDRDTGPNTGGMGAFSPASQLTPEMIADIIEKLRPLIAEVGFTGFLYVGLMITDEGWKVLEFNVRMGDPETQVVLPRLVKPQKDGKKGTDLFRLLYTMANGEDWTEPLQWDPRACVTVVMASAGYPGKCETGKVISGLRPIPTRGIIFHAGTKLLPDGTVVTSGGRVLNLTALGETVFEAADHAYGLTGYAQFEGEFHRSDIGLL